MLKSKKIVYFIICLLLFIGGLVFLDQQTTYLAVVDQNEVEALNGDIIIEMSSRTSVGYFKKAKLEEVEKGVYSIKAYFSSYTPIITLDFSTRNLFLFI